MRFTEPAARAFLADLPGSKGRSAARLGIDPRRPREFGIVPCIADARNAALTRGTGSWALAASQDSVAAPCSKTLNELRRCGKLKLPTAISLCENFPRSITDARNAAFNACGARLSTWSSVLGVEVPPYVISRRRRDISFWLQHTQTNLKAESGPRRRCRCEGGADAGGATSSKVESAAALSARDNVDPRGIFLCDC